MCNNTKAHKDNEFIFRLSFLVLNVKNFLIYEIKFLHKQRKSSFNDKTILFYKTSS